MPTYCLAVFNNRNSTMKFSQALKQNNIYNNVINTPRGLGSSCSVSVKFDLRDIRIASYLLRKGHFTSFVNFVKVTNLGRRETYEIINSI